MHQTTFSPLSVETLGPRLGNVSAVADRVGSDPSTWSVREVGDGNLNLVFIVEGPVGTVVVKQALPYVRLVGESWPLPLKRSYFEYHALMRQAERDPGRVPEIFHFDEAQALIVMEYLSPHIILRRVLIEGRMPPKIGRDLGLFSARTLFRGSDLSMSARARKADLALFADNVELCDITENLVFTDPYFEAELNRHTPGLEGIIADLRSDRDLKVEAQHLKQMFASRGETLLHGDLHTGSVMVTDDDTRVIDPEFAFYGPMAFDVGMLLANFWMNFFSQSGHEEGRSRAMQRDYIIDVIGTIWETFRAEFSRLFLEERSGMLYPENLFGDERDRIGLQQALDAILHDIFTDMLGFAGVEMHRRILGLAHNADFETIEDERLRVACETPALILGRHLVVNRTRIASIDEINSLVRRLEKEKRL